MSVDAREPRNASQYESITQDGIHVYYSRRLGRTSDSLELDYGRVLFRSRPILSGPEALVATVLMGRI